MKKNLLVTLVLFAVIFHSCKKPDNNTNPGVYATYSSIDTIFTMLQAPSKFVTFDASAGSSFYGSSGTRYVFPAGCFQDAYGNIVSGIVLVEVKELLNKGDMIFTKALPLSGTNSLISAGEIYTNATQSGQQLYLAPGASFQANVPQGKTPVPGMSFFSGNVIAGAANNVNWNAKDSTGTGSGAVIYNGDTIDIISDSLHWCNADQFMSNPDFQTFKVALSVAGNLTLPSQLNTYALYDTVKGFWTLGAFPGLSSYSNGVYSETHVPNIPVHFVSFCLINGKFYGGVTAAKPVNGGNYTIFLSQVDPTAFKGQLNNLTD